MTAIVGSRALRGPVTAVPMVGTDGVQLVANTDTNQVEAKADISSLTDDQIEALKKALGVDETVLWEGDITVNESNSFTLSESLANFNKFMIIDNAFSGQSYHMDPLHVFVFTGAKLFGTITMWTDTYNPTELNSQYEGFCTYRVSSDYLTVSTIRSGIKLASSSSAFDIRNAGHIYKVVGIGRKSA